MSLFRSVLGDVDSGVAIAGVVLGVVSSAVGLGIAVIKALAWWQDRRLALAERTAAIAAARLAHQARQLAALHRKASELAALHEAVEDLRAPIRSGMAALVAALDAEDVEEAHRLFLEVKEMQRERAALLRAQHEIEARLHDARADAMDRMRDSLGGTLAA